MLTKILPIYYRKRLLFNATLSVVQVVVLGATYFIIYTILLKNLGSQKLGTWSVVLSTSSIASIANIGLSSSLVKYIASYSNFKENNSSNINNLIKTSILSIGIFVGFVSICLYFLGFYLLGVALPISELKEARSLLPFSLISLWIGSLGGIFLSTLDGFHSSSLRSLIYIISALIFVLIGLQLLPYYGLMGIAIAQIIQAIAIVLLSFFGIKFVFKDFNIFPLHWDRATFDNIFKFSLDFQIIGLSQLLYDPVTKFFLARYGGLSFVGYYEMSSRLIVQIRTLIVSANQVMIPSIASSSVNNMDKSYAKVLNLVISVTFPTMVGVIVFTPYVCYYWIGHYEVYFMWSLLTLTISWCLNIMSTPAYFSCIGLGNLKGILFSHIFMAVANTLLGWIFGNYFAGLGVIMAWGISIAIGSIITLIFYKQNYRKGYIDVDKNHFYSFLIPSILCIVVCYYLFEMNYTHLLPLKLLFFTALIFCVYLLLLLSIYIKKVNYFLKKVQPKFKV